MGSPSFKCLVEIITEDTEYTLSTGCSSERKRANSFKVRRQFKCYM